MKTCKMSLAFLSEIHYHRNVPRKLQGSGLWEAIVSWYPDRKIRTPGSHGAGKERKSGKMVPGKFCAKRETDSREEKEERYVSFMGKNL